MCYRASSCSRAWLSDAACCSVLIIETHSGPEGVDVTAPLLAELADFRRVGRLAARRDRRPLLVEALGLDECPARVESGPQVGLKREGCGPEEGGVCLLQRLGVDLKDGDVRMREWQVRCGPERRGS